MKLSKLLVGNIAAGLVSASLIPSVYGKLTKHEEVTKLLDQGQIFDWVVQIGIIELFCIVIFAIPKTRHFGTVLMTAYFGGALCYHFVKGDAYTAPLVYISLVWIISFLRGFPFLATSKSVVEN